MNKHKYQATLTLKFDLTTVEELDGAKLTMEIRDFIKQQFIPRIKEVGTPGALFDTQITVEDVEPDDVPDIDEEAFKLAMADYLERRMEGGERCDCRTCKQVAMITDMLGDDALRKLINWLRTGEPMYEYDPRRLLQSLLLIGAMTNRGETFAPAQLSRFVPIHLN